MAEQEACTQLVEKASQEQSGGAIEGESLLLPLLQGLLEAPDNEQTADSGTESGEDQRSGLIAEVQNALDKLSASLRSDATDITPERRSSLLHLVTKLQAGLTTSPPNMERRSSSGQGRFNRRRQRQNRHTVGVSSEELADARRLMEEISLHPSQSDSKVPSMHSQNNSNSTILQKQNSESSVGQQSSSNSSSYKSYGKIPVKNAVAKPFSSSNSTSQSISGNSSSVQTPTDPSESLDLPFTNEEPKEVTTSPRIQDKKPNHPFRQSVSLDQPSDKIKRTLTESQSVDLSQDVDLKSVQHAVQQAAAIKVLAKQKSISESTQDSETDEDPSTVKAPQAVNEIVTQSLTIQPKSDFIIQTNPIYTKPSELSFEEKSNRFNSKKLKMKRANTIDIPKPLNFYEDEGEDTDTSVQEEDENQRRRNTYYALRGPIRVGNNVANKTNMPTLEAKTESDKKFLAFINKHNDNNNKASLWSNQNQTSVWGNKFGNIKTNFEKATTNQNNKSQNSARQFWKSSDDSVTAATLSHNGPRISKQSARNLQQMFEEKQKQTQQQKVPWSSNVSTNDKNVVTGSLKVNTKVFEPKVVPQPLPMNKFSHAPQSAFKPIPKKVIKPDSLKIQTKDVIKSEIKNDHSSVPNSPMYLYSPKPLFGQTQSDSNTSSPINPKPWVTNHGESRVLSLAASKFENHAPPQEIPPYKPRKLSKDINKIFVPTVPQQQPPEKLTAPYLVKSVDHNNKSSVRKLSGQYDNLNISKTGPDYTVHANVKYVAPPQEPIKQYYNSVTPSNNLNHSYQSNYNPSYHGHNQKQQWQEQQATIPPIYQQQYQYQPHNYNPEFHKSLQNFTPINYSITYDKPKPVIPKSQPKPVQDNYTQPIEDNQYVSTCQLKTKSVQTPQKQTSYNNEPRPLNHSQPANVSEPPKLESQVSVESVHEYTAVSSKVMSGPQSQQAVTVHQKSPMSREGHDMEAAFNLRNTLSKVNKTSPVSKSPTYNGKSSPVKPTLSSNSFSYTATSSVSPSSFNRNAEDLRRTPSSPVNKFKPVDTPPQIKSPTNYKENISPKPSSNYSVNNKPMSLESLEINDDGESIVTSKFHIPVINVPESPQRPTHAQVLSKSDSWYNICQQQTPPQHKPSPRASPNARTVMKSKSSHSLLAPKQFEAGMSKDEIATKKKTMEAYLMGGTKSPQPLNHENVKTEQPKVVKRSINRLKTSEKVSSYRHMTTTCSGLSRSRTLPDIVCPELLDESNVDEAFEDLFKSSS